MAIFFTQHLISLPPSCWCCQCFPTPLIQVRLSLYNMNSSAHNIRSEHVFSLTYRRGWRQGHRKLRTQIPDLGRGALSVRKLPLYIFGPVSAAFRYLVRDRSTRDAENSSLHQLSLWNTRGAQIFQPWQDNSAKGISCTESSMSSRVCFLLSSFSLSLKSSLVNFPTILMQRMHFKRLLSPMRFWANLLINVYTIRIRQTLNMMYLLYIHPAMLRRHSRELF